MRKRSFRSLREEIEEYVFLKEEEYETAKEGWLEALREGFCQKMLGESMMNLGWGSLFPSFKEWMEGKKAPSVHGISNAAGHIKHTLPYSFREDIIVKITKIYLKSKEAANIEILKVLLDEEDFIYGEKILHNVFNKDVSNGSYYFNDLYRAKKNFGSCREAYKIWVQNKDKDVCGLYQGIDKYWVKEDLIEKWYLYWMYLEKIHPEEEIRRILSLLEQGMFKNKEEFLNQAVKGITKQDLTSILSKINRRGIMDDNLYTDVLKLACRRHFKCGVLYHLADTPALKVLLQEEKKLEVFRRTCWAVKPNSYHETQGVYVVCDLFDWDVKQTNVAVKLKKEEKLYSLSEVYGMTLTSEQKEFVRKIISNGSKLDTLPSILGMFEDLKEEGWNPLGRNSLLVAKELLIKIMLKEKDIKNKEVFDICKETSFDIDEAEELDDHISRQKREELINNIPDFEAMEGDAKIFLMDKKDPRALVIGEYTGCCQSVGSEGEDCAIASVFNPNAGVLAFSHKGRPLAQAFVWVAGNAMILDNIEAIGVKEHKEVMKRLFKAAVAYYSSKGYEVYQGIGMNDIKLYNNKEKAQDNPWLDECPSDYSDARKVVRVA